jgi:hypothetical protein
LGGGGRKLGHPHPVPLLFTAPSSLNNPGLSTLRDSTVTWAADQQSLWWIPERERRGVSTAGIEELDEEMGWW